jgi:methylated-DNA-[protein]-cysteine S-methyltransferase
MLPFTYGNLWRTLMYATIFDSPIGPILLQSDGLNITEIRTRWTAEKHLPENVSWSKDCGLLQDLSQQLAEYFAGTRKTFDLPLKPSGTEFQKTVWQELTNVPYGATISYGTLAHRIGNSNASRAVGLANGRNPLPIVIPCHRVIGANGTLVGYGGGLPIKQFLLNLEKKDIPTLQFELDPVVV